MKTDRKLLIGLAVAALMIASFFAGCLIKEQEHSNSREQRCKTLILFAIDKVENGDISDQGVMKALISNVYAAYEFCDDPKVAGQLHDLWNILIFEGDSDAAAKEIALRELRAALESLQAAGT